MSNKADDERYDREKQSFAQQIEDGENLGRIADTLDRLENAIDQMAKLLRVQILRPLGRDNFAELYDALENFAEGHEEMCAINLVPDLYPNGTPPCDCGRDKARAALAKANPAKWGPGASTAPDDGTDATTSSQEKGDG